MLQPLHLTSRLTESAIAPAGIALVGPFRFPAAWRAFNIFIVRSSASPSGLFDSTIAVIRSAGKRIMSVDESMSSPAYQIVCYVGYNPNTANFPS